MGRASEKPGGIGVGFGSWNVGSLPGKSGQLVRRLKTKGRMNSIDGQGRPVRGRGSNIAVKRR